MPNGVERRKRVRLDHDERRALILDAARQQFSSRPYSEVSIADVADAAGVTRGLLHHYFGAKRELYIEVVREVVRIPIIPVPEDDPALRLTKVWEVSVDRWMELVEANRELWIASLNAGGVGHDHEVAAILDAGKEVVAHQALAAIGVDDPTPVMLALVRAYGGFSEELLREWLLRGRLDREQVRTLLAESMPLLVRELFLRVLDVPRSRPRASRPTG